MSETFPVSGYVKRKFYKVKDVFKNKRKGNETVNVARATSVKYNSFKLAMN